MIQSWKFPKWPPPRFGALILLCAPLLTLVHSLSAEHTNILLVAVDDLRPELASYGAAHIHSPHIDRLASTGLLFENAYIQQSVCGPSRISILSGLRPDSTGIFVNNFTLTEKHPGLISLPRHFRMSGYHTASLGKIYHHPHDDPDAWSEPVWRPFDIPWGWRNYRLPENLALVRELRTALPEKKRTATLLGRIKGPAFEATGNDDNVYPDGLTADMAVHTLRRLANEAVPFFLAVGFYKPHLPFACPQKYWDLYDRDAIELPQNDFPAPGLPEIAFIDSPELRAYHGIPSKGRLDDDLARTLIHGYRACVSYMDAQLGRVLDEIERLDLAKNTIVLLWSDHGWHLREHGIWGKMTNFELGTRIPLILRSPNHPASAGKRTTALVETVDIYPTLARLAGLPLPAHLEGASFASLLDDPARPWKKAAFSQFPRPRNRPHDYMGYSMRTERYRFTRWIGLREKNRNEVAGLELYDLHRDPGESSNLAADPAHADLVARLEKQLEAGWRAASAPTSHTP